MLNLSSRWPLQLRAVPHFNEVVKPALDAGLASVSPFQGPPCFPERKEIVQVVWDREQTLLVHL